MPQLVPVREYQPLDPYHHIADNGPIQDIETNLNLLNDVLDNVNDDLSSAIGTQGTLSNRLSISTNDDGTLKSAAIDQAQHNIADHTDGVDGSGTAYVRMLQTERDKLTQITDGATNLSLLVSTLTNTVDYTGGQVAFQVSDSIAWRVENDGLYADVLFPMTARHQHYYDLKPTPQNSLNPDYQNYVTTTVNTAYVAGSLRVYVNGTKISHYDTDAGAPPDVYFPRIDQNGNATWISLNYQEDAGSLTTIDGVQVVGSGKFALSAPITASDRITIEFDVLLD